MPICTPAAWPCWRPPATANALAQQLLARVMPFRHPGVSDRFYAAYTAAGIPA